ncbi:hypothetical protein NEOKW01_0923 [Nematocida sp. AWRm80]|nr:hypothetical protein NEOKW01_0923 [Nematocida sp. AWRm80]
MPAGMQKFVPPNDQKGNNESIYLFPVLRGMMNTELANQMVYVTQENFPGLVAVLIFTIGIAMLVISIIHIIERHRELSKRIKDFESTAYIPSAPFTYAVPHPNIQKEELL